jgi:hypothetical protein
VNFVSSATGRACLNDWHRQVEVADILTLLSNLKRAAGISGGPAVLIVVVRKTVPVPTDYVLNSLQATLPAILNSCQELVIAVEGDGAERSSLRACFKNMRPGLSRRCAAQVFDSLGDAFAHAQRFAPHDVLELQRSPLPRSLPTNRH